METLPKFFALKFRQFERYALFKLIGLIMFTMIFSTIAKETSQFLSEIVFFTGCSITLIALLGFASVKHYKNNSIVSTSNPILLQIYASSVYNKLRSLWQPISKILFVSIFYVFLIFAFIAMLFPFFAKVYGS